MVCQINIKKNPNILVLPPLRQPADTARRPFGKVKVVTIATRGTSVLWGVTQYIGGRLCHQRSNHLGGVELARGKHINDTARKIQSELLTSRLVDMQEKGGLRVVILLKNGKNSNENSVINVLFVGLRSLLQKTISFHYRKVVQIISQTFNPYAVVATAKSGNVRLDYFNIYEHKELLK